MKKTLKKEKNYRGLTLFVVILLALLMIPIIVGAQPKTTPPAGYTAVQFDSLRVGSGLAEPGAGNAVIKEGLGIGTANPTSKLHISSLGDADIFLEADTDNFGEGDQPSLILSQDGGYVNGKVGFFDNSNAFSIYSDYGSTTLGAANVKDHVIIESDGDVATSKDIYAVGSLSATYGNVTAYNGYMRANSIGRFYVSPGAWYNSDKSGFDGINCYSGWGWQATNNFCDMIAYCGSSNGTADIALGSAVVGIVITTPSPPAPMSFNWHFAKDYLNPGPLGAAGMTFYTSNYNYAPDAFQIGAVCFSPDG